jgi:hypothetical protein
LRDALLVISHCGDAGDPEAGGREPASSIPGIEIDDPARDEFVANGYDFTVHDVRSLRDGGYWLLDPRSRMLGTGAAIQHLESSIQNQRLGD